MGFPFRSGDHGVIQFPSRNGHMKWLLCSRMNICCEGHGLNPTMTSDNLSHGTTVQYRVKLMVWQLTRSALHKCPTVSVFQSPVLVGFNCARLERGRKSGTSKMRTLNLWDISGESNETAQKETTQGSTFPSPHSRRYAECSSFVCVATGYGPVHHAKLWFVSYRCTPVSISFKESMFMVSSVSSNMSWHLRVTSDSLSFLFILSIVHFNASDPHPTRDGSRATHEKNHGSQGTSKTSR